MVVGLGVVSHARETLDVRGGGRAGLPQFRDVGEMPLEARHAYGPAGVAGIHPAFRGEPAGGRIEPVAAPVATGVEHGQAPRCLRPQPVDHAIQHDEFVTHVGAVDRFRRKRFDRFECERHPVGHTHSISNICSYYKSCFAISRGHRLTGSSSHDRRRSPSLGVHGDWHEGERRARRGAAARTSRKPNTSRPCSIPAPDRCRAGPAATPVAARRPPSAGLAHSWRTRDCCAVGDWTTFFAAQVGASAALTGLVFVALSINLAASWSSRSSSDAPPRR